MDFPFLAVYSNDHVDVGVDKEKEEARSLRAPLGNQIKWNRVGGREGEGEGEGNGGRGEGNGGREGRPEYVRRTPSAIQIRC